ncbi:hypothetical protein [Wolbachia endosymbiont of Pentidionis agamae]|uniref:hypothetical protein n=1 Tax=Wolbachia endosymbiont of Pentidionis agamae TaxID=3110435 RepID=UPI002FD5E7B6
MFWSRKSKPIDPQSYQVSQTNNTNMQNIQDDNNFVSCEYNAKLDGNLDAIYDDDIEGEECNQSSFRIVGSLMYTIKYGAKASSLFAWSASKICYSVSYGMSYASDCPNWLAQYIENDIKNSVQDKESNIVQGAVLAQKGMAVISNVLYVASCMPYSAGYILDKVSEGLDGVSTYLSDNKIDQICKISDQLYERVCQGISTKINKIEVMNSVSVSSIATFA